MLPSALVLDCRREERVQKACSVDHHGPGDARLSHSAKGIYGELGDTVAKVPPGLRRGTTLVSKLKEHIKSLSIDISPTAFAAWRKAGCRKRPAQESEGAEESEAAEEPGAVRASPRSLGPPGQEAGSSDESSEEGGRPRPSPVLVDLTAD